MVQSHRTPHHRFERFKLKEDYRGRLPPCISRFLGYRPPEAKSPFDPLPFPPFTWLHKIPLKYEVWLFSWIGGFISILLIEAIMSTSTAFRNDYHAPTIIVSFGASAVLLFSSIESPLSQPRNFILGHFFSSLIGTAITRLFVLNGNYQGYLDNSAFHGTVFINGGVSMATSALVMVMIGAVHPPAGATALNAAVQADIVSLSWRYIPTVLASSLIMLGWALIVNNLGRRRYPIYWWSPGVTFVSTSVAKDAEMRKDELLEVEEGLGITEGVLFAQVSNSRSGSATQQDESVPNESGRSWSA